jgi:hypothetical protein
MKQHTLTEHEKEDEKEKCIICHEANEKLNLGLNSYREFHIYMKLTFPPFDLYALLFRMDVKGCEMLIHFAMCQNC